MHSSPRGRKTSHPGRTPWLATLLLAALAACGGNTGDGSSTGSTELKSGGSRLQTRAPGDEATPAANAGGAAAVATAPISADGVRGDVLAQALRTSTSQPDPDGAGQPVPTRVWPSSDVYPRSKADKTSKVTSFFVDQRISADEGKSGLGTHVSSNHAFAMPDFNTGKLSFAGVEWRVGLSGQGDLPADLAQGAADAEALQLGTQLPVTVKTDPSRRGDDTSVKSVTVTATAPYSLRRNALLGWNKALHSWKASETSQPGNRVHEHSVDLLVLKGSQADQFAACFKFNVATYVEDRLHCGLWQVPTDWAPGKPLVYQGQYVNDVLSYYTGDGSSRSIIDTYWISDPAAIHGKAEATNPSDPGRPGGTPDKAKTPISDKGISGGVLATMLDAMSPRGEGAANLPPFAPAAEAETPDWALDKDMYSSKPASVVRQPLRVSLQQLARSTRYADGATSGAYAPAVGTYLYLQRSGAWQSTGDPMRRVYGHAVLTLALPVTNERNGDSGSVLLSRWLGVRDQTVNDKGEPGDHSAELRGLSTPDAAERARAGDPAGSKRYAHDDLVRYGTVHDWRFNNRDQRVQLTVQPHRDASNNPLDDQVRLCWEISKEKPEPDVLRHVCTVWQVPTSWTYGQALAPRSFHMYDYSLGPTRLTPYRQVWSSTVR